MISTLFSKKITTKLDPFSEMRNAIHAAIDNAEAAGVDAVDIYSFMDGLEPGLKLKADAASDRRRFAQPAEAAAKVAKAEAQRAARAKAQDEAEFRAATEARYARDQLSR